MSRLANGFEFEIPTDVFFKMMTGTLVLLAIAAVVAIGVRIARTWQPEHQLRAIDELSRKMNLTVPDHLREPLAHAVAVRKRGAEVASLVGTGCVGLALALMIRPWSDSSQEFSIATILVLVAVPGLFTTCGAALGGLLARRETPTTPRTARLTALTYRDLIAPVEQRLLAFSVACGITVPAVLMVATLAPWADTALVRNADAPALLCVGLAAAVLWLALPRISRRLVSTRALAGDEHALAWSDALAGRLVRDLTYFAMTASGMAAVFGIMALGLTLPREWDGVGAAFPNGALLIGFMAGLSAWIIVSGRQPERHIQRTLWPEFAADAK